MSEWAATSDQVKLLMAGHADARDFAVWTPSSGAAVAPVVADRARAAACSSKRFENTPRSGSGLLRQIATTPFHNSLCSMVNDATRAPISQNTLFLVFPAFMRRKRLEHD